MAIRTVRLDEETEQTLKHVVERSGMNISTALKQGLKLLNKDLSGKASVAPYEIFNQLDLGEGGEAQADSTDIGSGLRDMLQRKHSR